MPVVDDQRRSNGERPLVTVLMPIYNGRALRQPSRLRPFWHRVSSGLFPGAKARWPSHAYGMVGFLKQLIDEQGIADALKRGKKGVASGRSKFESMLIAPGIAFITKNSP